MSLIRCEALFFYIYYTHNCKLGDKMYYKWKCNYCPYKYKYELVNWASNRFDKPKSFFNSKSIKQLYAIYYNTK